MDSKLIQISTVNMSHNDWLAYRKNGLGASEIGTVMGLNPYKSSLELYYEKIGLYDRLNIENLACFMGKEQEAFVADLWQYWGGSTESLIENYRAGKKVRICRKVNAYISNPEYPHLFVSLDRIGNNIGGGNEINVEIKTIAGFEANKWEAGIPPQYIFQVMTQLGVCNLKYGEMAILTDGRQFDVFPFEFNKGVFQRIINDTKIFWDKVEKGRILVNQKFEATRNFNNKLANEIQREIEHLEPSADGSEAYANFLKKKHTTIVGERMGTDVELKFAIDAKKLNEKIKEIEEKIQYCENSLMRSMGDIQTLNFKDKGKVHFKFNKNNNRIFSNKIKL